MADFNGIEVPDEEREILEANEIITLENLQQTSFRQLSYLIGEAAAKEIENSLIEKTGLPLNYSKRKSLRTA